MRQIKTTVTDEESREIADAAKRMSISVAAMLRLAALRLARSGHAE